jgi:hypothetical protein
MAILRLRFMVERRQSSRARHSYPKSQPPVELHSEDLLRHGSKLAQESRQLVSDAKRLLYTSAKLISSSHTRRKGNAQ